MTREDRIAWHSHPATQDLIGRIAVEYEGIKEEWASGRYVTHEDQLEAIGRAKALMTALDLVEVSGGKEDE